jgi:hypothetical protein
MAHQCLLTTAAIIFRERKRQGKPRLDQREDGKIEFLRRAGSAGL